MGIKSVPLKKQRKQLLLAAFAAAAAGAATAAGSSAVMQGFDGLLPDASRIASFSRPGTVTVLSADGQVLQKLGPATREKVANGQMPLLIQQAFIAAEDRRFYKHNGVDIIGIGRAIMTNISNRSVEQGASTITQQLARVVFLNQDRTLLRKLKEAALAFKLERQLSKQQILEQYLNNVYLGSSAYGVADAAWVYFSKSSNQLTLPEAALIAGLPPAPSVYSPLVNSQLALERRSIVLKRMVEAGFINTTQLERANASALLLKPAVPKHWNSTAPYFTNWVAQELPKVLTPEQLELGGLTIRTSLNSNWQKIAQKVIDQNAYGDLQGALVSIEPGTGLVRAMVGGRDFQKSQFNRATQALRSPGSTFKLFDYTAAVAAGIKPEQIFIDAPRCWSGYCPKNSDDRYLGAVSMADALQNSINTVAVQLLEKVGFDAVINNARSLGITRPLGRYYSLALGSNEQTVLDMTAAYAAINNRGIYIPPTPFESISGLDGRTIWARNTHSDRGRRAVDSDTADTVMWMLQRVVSGGTGAAAGLVDRAVAGKTGTSEGARDLWFIGSIPQLTTGVWFGFDNNRKTGSSSAQAAWAWNQFMQPVVKDMPVKQFPPKPILNRSFIAPGTPAAAPVYQDPATSLYNQNEPNNNPYYDPNNAAPIPGPIDQVVPEPTTEPELPPPEPVVDPPPPE